MTNPLPLLRPLSLILAGARILAWKALERSSAETQIPIGQNGCHSIRGAGDRGKNEGSALERRALIAYRREFLAWLKLQFPASFAARVASLVPACSASPITEWAIKSRTRRVRGRIRMGGKSASPRSPFNKHDFRNTRRASFSSRPASLGSPSFTQFLSARAKLACPPRLSPHLAPLGLSPLSQSALSATNSAECFPLLMVAGRVRHRERGGICGLGEGLVGCLGICASLRVAQSGGGCAREGEPGRSLLSLYLSPPTRASPTPLRPRQRRGL